MPYVFDTSERTTASGNAAETKALLHLLSFDEDCDKVDAFAIDCFNDVTGMDKHLTTLFDVQSKAKTNIAPKEIGRNLVTLYRNYISDFASYFASYTLFLGGVSQSVLEDNSCSIFRFHDVKPVAQSRIRDGLKDACDKKRYITGSGITDDSIDSFLNVVKFVIAKQNEIEYLYPLIKISDAAMPSERTLQALFNEIRNTQSCIKNNPSIANKAISHPDEVYDYSRVLNRRQIDLFVLQRLINRNPMKDPVPASFEAYLNDQPPELQDEIIEDCQNAITLQYFDKNNKDAFWRLFDSIIREIDKDDHAGVRQISNNIDSEIRNACIHLNRRALLYLIANIKDGTNK